MNVIFQQHQQPVAAKQQDALATPAFVGTCNDMCPEPERRLRLGGPMPIFEKNSQTNEPNEWAMVKEYRRAGADQEEPKPHDLRTPQALEKSLNYLAAKVMDDPRSNEPSHALDWYDYLWDRLRAIRKDITQQNICDPAAAILVERCARFHIHSCYSLKHIKNFDENMNKRNLNDCLQMVRHLYEDLKSGSSIRCPGELQFLKYDILLHLDDDPLATLMSMKTSEYRSCVEFKFTTQIYQSYLTYDYCRFFKLMLKADYMTSCLLSLYANKMRIAALKSIIASSQPKQTSLYPAELFIRSLAFEDVQDAQRFLAQVDIQLTTKNSNHYFSINRTQLNSLRSRDLALAPFQSHLLVTSKRNGRSVGQIICDSDIPQQHVSLPMSTKQDVAEMELDMTMPYEMDAKSTLTQMETESIQTETVEKSMESDMRIKYIKPSMGMRLPQPKIDFRSIQPVIEIRQRQPVMELKPNQPVMETRSRQQNVETKSRHPVIEARSKQPEIILEPETQPSPELYPTQPEAYSSAQGIESPSAGTDSPTEADSQPEIDSQPGTPPTPTLQEMHVCQIQSRLQHRSADQIAAMMPVGKLKPLGPRVVVSSRKSIKKKRKIKRLPELSHIKDEILDHEQANKIFMFLNDLFKQEI